MNDKLIRDIWKLAHEMTVLVKNSNAELDAELMAKFVQIDRELEAAGYFPNRMKR